MVFIDAILLPNFARQIVSATKTQTGKPQSFGISCRRRRTPRTRATKETLKFRNGAPASTRACGTATVRKVSDRLQLNNFEPQFVANDH